MTLRSLIAREVHEAVGRLLRQSGLEWPGGLELSVEQPARVEHGDYTTNVAFQLARHLRKPPIQIAAQLAGELRTLPMASRVEAAAPGFVNIWLDWGWWATHGTTRPEPSRARSAEKVLVEHTSINPNKSAHVGHLRNACIGDTLGP